MKHFSILFGVFFLGISPIGNTNDVPLRLAPAQPNDMIPKALISAKGLGVDTSTSRDTVTFSWAIEEEVALDFSPKPFQAESREFWTTLKSGQLQHGVDIVTTAPGAVVRISPIDGHGATVDLDGLQVIYAGHIHSGKQAVQHMADASQLQHSGVPFPQGTAAFRLKRNLGAGRMTLKLPKTPNGALLHVFEPDSDHLLYLAATNDIVPSGDTLHVRGRFDAKGVTRTPSLVQGIVTAPNGTTWPMDFHVGTDGFDGSLRLDGLAGHGPGLWEAHVFAALSGADGLVLRDTRTAFAVSVMTARLDGSVISANSARGDLAFEIGMEVAMAARYELRGVLMGTDKNNRRVALAVGNTAAWLEPGKAKLPLTFNANAIARNGIGAPFEVRDLRLIRQGDMDLQERRTLGFRIESM